MATHQLLQRHQSRIPPGFRFHPTDEELVGYYLHKKVSARRIDLDVIREIDLYKMEPWDLQEKCRIGSAEQNEWYFFSQKDKKYPTGTRTNRATTAGFWKATGRDKTIHTKYSFVGMRKTLVFYKGRAPNGQKTDWIMHEYRLEDEQACNNNASSCVASYNSNQEGNHWVVCRVFKKKVNLKDQKNYQPSPEPDVDESTLPQDFSFPSSNSHHQDSNSNSYLMTTAPTVSPSFADCKQEKQDMSALVFNDSFSRLPQLESPTISSNSGTLNVGSTNIMKNSFPPSFVMERVMEFEQQNNKFSQVQQAFLDEQLMTTNWRAYDKLAATQPTISCSPDSDDYAGVLMRLSKQDLDEADLWSFAS